MSIKPDVIYSEFMFLTDEVHWIMKGNLSGNLVAGLVVAIRTIYSRIHDHLHYSIQIRSIDNIIQIGDDDFEYYMAINYYLSRTINNIYDFHTATAYPLQRGIYYWPIFNKEQSYDLFCFQPHEFIQGFISICHAFQVNFTDYVIGNPFMYHETKETPTYYSIEF